MGRQNITLVSLDCRCERPGNLRNAGIRFKEFHHALVLPGQGHDFRWRWQHGHAECRPVDVDRGQPVANEIVRSTRRLSLEALIEQGDDLGNLARGRGTCLFAVSVLSTQWAVGKNSHIPYQTVLSEQDGAQAEDVDPLFNIVGDKFRAARCTDSFSQGELFYPYVSGPFSIVQHGGQTRLRREFIELCLPVFTCGFVDAHARVQHSD